MIRISMRIKLKNVCKKNLRNKCIHLYTLGISTIKINKSS